MAHTQQFLVQALRQIEFTAMLVVDRLPVGNPNELGGITQLLPQLSCAGTGIPAFRRARSFDGDQDRRQPVYSSISCRRRSGVFGSSASWSKPFWNCAA